MCAGVRACFVCVPALHIWSMVLNLRANILQRPAAPGRCRHLQELRLGPCERLSVSASRSSVDFGEGRTASVSLDEWLHV